MICLDTNIVISILNGRNPSLRQKLEEQLGAGTKVGMPVVALFEMRFGIAKSNRREQSERLLERFLGLGIDVLSFDAEDATHAGDIRAHLESKGTPIGPYDCLIAAQARRRGATLVTANGREFQQVPGLMVTDWAA
ncbi:MAG TPA: type II toxin-antitoxin system VapC family toxin [Bradyrhizobium sp.]|nr:type II toxin-antitoxin system VapC family toxin [Bradyrhizobium sp.]